MITTVQSEPLRGHNATKGDDTGNENTGQVFYEEILHIEKPKPICSPLFKDGDIKYGKVNIDKQVAYLIGLLFFSLIETFVKVLI